MLLTIMVLAQIALLALKLAGIVVLPWLVVLTPVVLCAAVAVTGFWHVSPDGRSKY